MGHSGRAQVAGLQHDGDKIVFSERRGTLQTWCAVSGNGLVGGRR